MNSDKTRILSQLLPGQTPLQRARLPWIAVASASFLFFMVAAFGTVRESTEPPLARKTVVEALALPASDGPSEDATEFWTEERFQRGDTFAALLERLGVEETQAARLLRAPGLGSPFRWLRPGTTVQARVSAEGELHSLWFIAGRDLLVSVDRDGEAFRAAEQPVSLTRRVLLKSGEIRSSLFAATDAADISDNIAIQIADVFAGDVDFHRDLRRGDRFAVVYEMFFHNGREVKSGRVLAAEFINQGKSFRAIWYPDADEGGGKKGGYFTPQGKNLRKAFLRSPLEFSRISSGFGLRMHPILQRWRAHRGVDYAAPTGTRVKATGDGVVESISRETGYGNVVVLRHYGGYTTWYAHLSGFARGLRKGARVAQGDVIGYVGQTGWATGPHLHYEFRVRDQHRNPLTIAFPASQPLAPEKLPAFHAHAQPLAAQLDLLRNANLALLE